MAYRFRLSASGFGGGLTQSTRSNGSNFVSGRNPFALGSRPTFLYNTSTNVFSFDQNGSRGGGVFDIATLSNGHNLQASQIQLQG